MKSLIPRSMSGQIAMVMAGALLIASAVNFALLLAERYRADINEQSGPAIARFVDNAAEVVVALPPARQRPITVGRPQAPGRYMVTSDSPFEIRNLQRDGGLEQRLRQALSDAGIAIAEVRASARDVDRPFLGPGRAGGPLGGPGLEPMRPQFEPGPGAIMSRPPGGGPSGPPPGGFREAREITLSGQLPDGRWLTGTTFSPQVSGEFWRLGASTFITFAFVLGAALWIARRVSRPLSDLTTAAARVGAATEPEEVTVRGPGDVRQTLEAFNAMSRRVSQLLGEKDVMLGALGHDLRTPLSSLRIRIESMEPEAERLKAIKTIEEASELLEDILDLARQGRSNEPVQTMDVSILVQDIVEDYVETGAPVSLAATDKSPVACRPVLLRRALRNLIDNAVSYGLAARLAVVRTSSEALIRIEDDGPGMSHDALATATRPFIRGEASRNSKTGGTGLGLTLADAIAKAHGGSLELSNRNPHGLAATIHLPLVVPPVA